MQFHYDKTLEQKVEAMPSNAEETPAWLMICLAKSLKEWLGQSCRVSYRDGETQLQLGYEVLSVPVLEFAQSYAPLVYKVNSIWPVQIFGMADNRELIELCLLCKNVGKVLTHTFITQQIWGRSWENDIASLRVFMATLRKKLEKEPGSVQYIQTHIGVGYRMMRVEP